MSRALEALRTAYGKIATLNPEGEGYKNLCKFLDAQDAATLLALSVSDIKFVSKLAANRYREIQK